VIIEIKGVEFENKGAHLMLMAITQQLKVIWPEAIIALSHSAKASFTQRSTVALLRKVALRKHLLDLNRLSYWLPVALRRLLMRWGLVTEADIDLLVDASGFSYSDQWPSKLRIVHLKSELLRFRRYNKPYIFLPQAFGPFTSGSSCRCIAKSFQYAAMICARERQSFMHIEQLTGSISNLHQYGDFTNLAEGFVPRSFDAQTRWACIVPNKNMLNLRTTNRAWLSRYESLIVEAIEYYLERGLSPFFLNHESDEDGALIERINALLVDPIPVISEFDPLAVKGIIGASQAVMCSRFHGCISAMSQGIACVGTSWSHKYEMLYEQYAASSLLLQPEMSTQELRQVIDLSLDEGSELHQGITNQALILKADSVSMWQEFQTTVNSYIPFLKSS
jgi:polysaccharide pyruvyl transferase WcaK-like protein